jgi:ABC-2 type transport system permease protein
MPFKARDVIIGKIAPYFLVASIDMAVVLFLANLLFDVPFRGSLWILTLGSMLFLLVTLGVGVLISTVSENQGQAIQLGLMTLMPQVILSGIIFPLDSMEPGVRWIGYLLPLSYFNIISKGVMLKATPITGLLWPFALLLLLGSIVFGLAMIRFSRDLIPTKPAATEGTA